MKNRLRTAIDELRFSTERDLAPHVDPAWAEAVLLELRMQGVAGTRIGAALAEVDAHCVDSGESASDTFGEPVAYARSLGLPPDPAQSGAGVLRVVGASALQLCGMALTLTAVAPAVHGGTLSVTVGMLVALLGLLAGVVALGVLAERALRFVVLHPVLAVVALAVLSALLGAIGVLVRAPVGAIAALPVLVVGVALLVAGTAWQVRETSDSDDPVVGPLEEPVEVPRAVSRRVSWATALAVPVLTVPLALVTLLAP